MKFDEQDWTLHDEIASWLWALAFLLGIVLAFVVGVMWIAEKLA